MSIEEQPQLLAKKSSMMYNIGNGISQFCAQPFIFLLRSQGYVFLRFSTLGWCTKYQLQPIYNLGLYLWSWEFGNIQHACTFGLKKHSIPFSSLPTRADRVRENIKIREKNRRLSYITFSCLVM